MKISELIDRLLEIGKVHGDLEIKTKSPLEDGGDWDFLDIDVIEFDDVKYVRLS